MKKYKPLGDYASAVFSYIKNKRWWGLCPQLIQGDCLEAMKNMPDDSIDLTVTSPPYDNLRSYNGNNKQWNYEKFKGIAKELFRITKQGGVVVWIVNDATINGSETGTSFKQALFFKECGFNLHDTMIWKKAGTPYPQVIRYYPNFEYMFILSKGKPKTVNLIADRINKHVGEKITATERQRDGTLKESIGRKKGRRIKPYGVRFNVWEIRQASGNKTGHPAVFPERLATDHILSWSNEGDIVFDCFMGSGSTGIACINTNRQFIGIEIDNTYYEIAKQRINDAVFCLKK